MMKRNSIRERLKRSGATSDLTLIVVVSVLLFSLAVLFEAFEHFIEWAEQYEMWQVDELIFVLAVLPVAFGIYAWRRWREAKIEMARRERLEEALRESELNFRSSLDNSPLGIAILSRDRRMRYVNQALLDIHGYRSLNELEAIPLERRYTPDSLVKLRQSEHDARSGKTIPDHYERSIVRKDGTIRHLEVFRKWTVWDGERHTMRIYLDITERKRAEEAVNASEAKFRNLFEHMNDAVFLADAESGLLIDANQAACQMLGRAKDEVVGMRQTQVHPPEEIDHYRELVIKHLKEGKEITEDVFVLRSDGSRIPVDISINSLELAGKRVIQGVFRDITARRHMRQERERLLNELKEKTKELEQIIYVTSHDLRSPLVNVQGFTRELEQALKEVRSLAQGDDVPPSVKDNLAVPLNEDIPEALKYILASTAKMDTLLSGLLRLSRLGRAALSIEDLDMNELLSDVTHAFEFYFKEAGAKLEALDLPSCRGDRIQINQAFSNLIGNALKFLEPSRPGVIRVSGNQSNGQAVYCVEDNGIGIAPAHQARIFEIFQRLEPEGSPGEGLGLTIVRRILDRHSGKVWVESEPGKGSRFFVALPAIEDKQKGVS